MCMNLSGDNEIGVIPDESPPVDLNHQMLWATVLHHRGVAGQG